MGLNAKALVLRLAENIRNAIIDEHTLDYQPFLRQISPTKAESEVPISHRLWKRLEQKSQANNEIPKKQLKKCIYLK